MYFTRPHLLVLLVTGLLLSLALHSHRTPEKNRHEMADAKAAKRTRFEAVFITIRDELVAFFESHNMPRDAVDWFARVRPPSPRLSLSLVLTYTILGYVELGLQRPRREAQPRHVRRRLCADPERP